MAKGVAAPTNIDTVNTGHFPATVTMADLNTCRDFVREFVHAVQAPKRVGRTIDDFVATWKLPERFVKEGYVDVSHLGPLRPDVEVVWGETK